jgi:general secretion pathway protein G
LRARGFTLIELVITVAIKRSKESELRVALREIRDAIDAYKLASSQGRVTTAVDSSGYPPNLQALVDGVDDARSPNKVKIYFLRRIPRDPFFPDGSVPAAETWGLRSYESPPDAPEAGADVFDVYSLAPGKGINGVPYRDW